MCLYSLISYVKCDCLSLSLCANEFQFERVRVAGEFSAERFRAPFTQSNYILVVVFVVIIVVAPLPLVSNAHADRSMAPSNAIASNRYVSPLGLTG